MIFYLTGCILFVIINLLMHLFAYGKCEELGTSCTIGRASVLFFIVSVLCSWFFFAPLLVFIYHEEISEYMNRLEEEEVFTIKTGKK